MPHWSKEFCYFERHFETFLTTTHCSVICQLSYMWSVIFKEFKNLHILIHCFCHSLYNIFRSFWYKSSCIPYKNHSGKFRCNHIYDNDSWQSKKSSFDAISKLSQVPTMKPSKLTVKVPKKLYKRVSSARSSGKRLKIALKRKKSVSSVFQDQRNLHQWVEKPWNDLTVRKKLWSTIKNADWTGKMLGRKFGEWLRTEPSANRAKMATGLLKLISRGRFKSFFDYSGNKVVSCKEADKPAHTVLKTNNTKVTQQNYKEEYIKRLECLEKYGKNFYCPSVKQRSGLRPVYIDGSNVAFR